MATGDVLLTLTPMQYAEYTALRARLAEAERERDQFRGIAMKLNHEIEQILGAALRYPRYCDSPETFPDATEADGVCVGDHVAETLAMEAAARIGQYRATLERVRDGFDMLAHSLNGEGLTESEAADGDK